MIGSAVAEQIASQEMLKERTIDQATIRLLKNVVATNGHGYDISVIRVEPGVNDYGMDYVLVELKFAYTDEPIDSEKTLNLLSAMSRALQENGDDRFVVTRYDMDDRQPIKRVPRAK